MVVYGGDYDRGTLLGPPKRLFLRGEIIILPTSQSRVKVKYIMVQQIGYTLVVLLGKSYFIRRQKCS